MRVAIVTLAAGSWVWPPLAVAAVAVAVAAAVLSSRTD